MPASAKIFLRQLVVLLLLIFAVGADQRAHALNSFLKFVEINNVSGDNTDDPKLSVWTDYWRAAYNWECLMGDGFVNFIDVVERGQAAFIPPYLSQATSEFTCEQWVTQMQGAIPADVCIPAVEDGGAWSEQLTKEGTLRAAVDIMGDITKLIGNVLVAFHLPGICTSSFAILPNELVNIKNGAKVRVRGGKAQFYFDDCDDGSSYCTSKTQTNADGSQQTFSILTEYQYPFFYTCDKSYNAYTGGTIENFDPSKQYPATDPSSDAALPLADKVYKYGLWGYMGRNTSLCPPGNTPNYITEHQKDIGYLYAGHVFYSLSRIDPIGAKEGSINDKVLSVIRSNPDRYRIKVGTKLDDPSDVAIDSRPLDEVRAYYRSKAGKAMACATAKKGPSYVIMGCIPATPPNDITPTVVTATRCDYFLQNRDDLSSYALSQGLAYNSHLGRFLMGDFHMLSTSMGCIKDIIIAMFTVKSDDIDKEGYIVLIQKAMRDIVFVFMVLFIAITGIKIISSPQAPKKKDIFTWIAKIALISYFMTPQAWFNVNEEGRVEGIFPTLIYGGEEIGSYFVKAYEEGIAQVLPFCHLPTSSYTSEYEGELNVSRLQGAAVLFEQLVPASGAGGLGTTAGQGNNVRFSLWDYFDCKVANYLNFSSCSYNVAWMFVGLLFNFTIFSGGKVLIFGIMSLLYALFLITLVIKLAQLVVSAAIIIAFLIAMSPIIFIASLFQPTFHMFQTWFKSLIGYMLYPAIIAAYLVMVIAAVDSIYYGDLTQYDVGSPSTSSSGDVTMNGCKQQEATNDPSDVSPYCKALLYYGKSPCQNPEGWSWSELFSQSSDIPIFGFVNAVSTVFTEDLFVPMLKLLIMMLALHFFTGSFVTYIGYMFGTQGAGGQEGGFIVNPISYVYNKVATSEMTGEYTSALASRASKAVWNKGLAVGEKVTRGWINARRWQVETLESRKTVKDVLSREAEGFRNKTETSRKNLQEERSRNEGRAAGRADDE
jgi:type IV secretory pathway VirB6-like protein